MFMLRLFYLYLVFLSLNSHASFLEGDFRGHKRIDFGFTAEGNPRHSLRNSFIHPNEVYPEAGVPFWKESPVGGIYMGVGTERLFMAFAYSRASFLLCIDRDPVIVSYNRMTINLLKLAKNGETFYQLRTNVDYLKRTLSELAEETKEHLDFDFMEKTANNPLWSKEVSVGNKLWFWKTKTELEYGLEMPYERKMVRYWENEELYQKIKKAASENRIQAELIEINNPKDRVILAAAIARSSQKVSVFDWSNAYLKDYITPHAIEEIHQLLTPYFSAKAFYLGTWFCPYMQFSEDDEVMDHVSFETDIEMITGCKVFRDLEYFALSTEYFTSKSLTHRNHFLRALKKLPPPSIYTSVRDARRNDESYNQKAIEKFRESNRELIAAKKEELFLKKKQEERERKALKAEKDARRKIANAWYSSMQSSYSLELKTEGEEPKFVKLLRYCSYWQDQFEYEERDGSKKWGDIKLLSKENIQMLRDTL